MASLLDLPMELLDQVLAPSSVSTLSKLSRTTRGLHTVLSPRVYNSIDWYWEDDAEPPPFHLLLRTLLRNPSQARHITSLQLRAASINPGHPWYSWWPYQREGGWKPPSRAQSICLRSCFSAADFQKVRLLVSDTFHPPSPTWISEFGRGNIDVLIALLLSCLPSLIRLNFNFAYLYHSQFIPAILRQGMINHDRGSFLSELRSVELALDVPRYSGDLWCDLDLLRPFFFLPSVERIIASFPEPVLLAWPRERPRSSSLTTLVLSHSSILENTLNELLSATPALKRLTYNHFRHVDWNYPEHGNSNQIRCWRLDKALSHVQNTLQSLIIKIGFGNFEGHGIPDGNNYDGPWGVSGRLTILKQMHQLTHLEIPWELLFGWNSRVIVSWTDSLTSSLETICMRDDLCSMAGYEWRDNITLSRIIQLLNFRHEYFGNLRRVSFAHVWADIGRNGGWHDGNADMVRSLCESEKVECEIIREASPWQ